MRKRFHWKIIGAAIAAALGVCAGCAAGADYYGKEEAIRYARAVHGSGTAFVREERYRYADGSRAVQYVFKDSAGRKFTIRTESVEESESGSVQKGISDSYYDAVITDQLSRIQALIDDSGLDMRLEQTGSTDVKDNRTWRIALYLDRTDDFGAASMLIAKIDSLLAYRSDRTASEIGRGQADSKSVTVYMQPDTPAEGDTAENWKESRHLPDYRIASVDFTNGGDRMSASEADSEIENDFVDTVKLRELVGEESFYDIPDTLRSKYNAPVLNVTSVQGHHPQAGQYVFYYDRDSGEYWMTDLDPCQDFDGFPYEYAGRGNFARLVQWLGGSYSCSDWKARWSIGNYSWSASLTTKKASDSSYAFKNMRIARGDTFLTLSDPASDIPGGGRNQTPSGRAYSIGDLVRMLHANITINEDTMTAMIYSDEQK